MQHESSLTNNSSYTVLCLLFPNSTHKTREKPKYFHSLLVGDWFTTLFFQDAFRILFFQDSRWPIKICAFAVRIPCEQDKKAFSAMDVIDGSTEPAIVGLLESNTEMLLETGRVLTGVVSAAST